MACNSLFDCSETPLKFPNGLFLTDLATCKDCKVRFTAQSAGPGKLTTSTEGFIVDESPLVSFVYNGVSHTLYDTRLLMEGAHILPGKTEAADAEFHMYFKGDKNPASVYCLVITVKVGTGVGNTYFATLDEMTLNRPTVGTLVTADAPLLYYIGADIRGRTKMTPRPSVACTPVGTKIRYMVSTREAYIKASDLARLNDKMDNTVYVGPPQASVTSTAQCVKELVTRIPSMIIVSTAAGGPSAAGSSTTVSVTTDTPIPTKALKCHRLDTQKDIVGDKVYVGGRPGTTLQDEMEAAANSQSDYVGEDKPTIQPGDVENWVAIALGTVVGLVIAAAIAFYALRFVYAKYLKSQGIYGNEVTDPVADVGKLFTDAVKAAKAAKPK